MRLASMPRLYLDLHECGTVIPDEEGSNFSSLDEARTTAVTAARALMADEVMRGNLCVGCCIEMRDERGATVASIRFRDVLTITGL